MGNSRLQQSPGWFSSCWSGLHLGQLALTGGMLLGIQILGCPWLKHVLLRNVCAKASLAGRKGFDHHKLPLEITTPGWESCRTGPGNGCSPSALLSQAYPHANQTNSTHKNTTEQSINPLKTESKPMKIAPENRCN